MWIALSGGLDSTLLAHLAAYCYPTPHDVRAIHVNHQLQPNADATERFCRQLCEQLAIPLTCRRVDVQRSGGRAGGLEESARQARYDVFEQLLEPSDLLLMAHHADDQAETLLFRLIRGTGVRGLAGMPRKRPLGKGLLYRPLLDFSRGDLSGWATAAGLPWIDDPSNADARFDRNFLRQRVLPLIRSRWPELNRRISHTARACGESVFLADRLAALHWEQCADHCGRLVIERLAGLCPVERKNLITWWIRGAGYPEPALRDWGQVIGELIGARQDGAPEIVGEGFAIRRFSDRLYLVPATPEALPVDAELSPQRPLRWGEWSIRLIPASEQTLPNPAIRVSTRQGGETFQPTPRGYDRPLKKWLQEQAVPPWERARLPLVFSVEGDQQRLIAIGDLWCSGQYSGSAPAAGWRLIVERDCD
ncbi:cell cycle protein MesJ [Marinobacter santoriniensis NKSG1]|uniref:tRNA(Ile)-lysidine synthase n=1 Tax=Marinobacter santoriniensis NKSG1 TaxID=1288826 RepID=M7CW80_9GAMM|nr:cell cycle protein MesJ [Marinobacter santoriniensis NKSG1]